VPLLCAAINSSNWPTKNARGSSVNTADDVVVVVVVEEEEEEEEEGGGG
jgi:hypothetical protein